MPSPAGYRRGEELGPLLLGLRVHTCEREVLGQRARAAHLQGQRLPREERDRVQALLEIEGFLEQQNILAKNIARLRMLARSPDEEVRQKAGLALEVAHLAPRKRKRHSNLVQKRADLH